MKASITGKRRRGAGRIGFVVIPTWALSNHQDGGALASALSLAELENRWVRLSADTQRKIVGYPVFGKQMIYSDGTSVRVHRSVAFGTDSDVREYSWGDVTSAAREGKKL